MPRSVFRFTSPQPQQQVFDTFMSYFNSEGFAYHVEEGEQCLKKGVGVATAPQFVKINALDGVYTLEAWIKFAVVPGAYVHDMDLKGFTGALPKSQLKTRVNNFLFYVQAQNLQVQSVK